MPIYEFYSPDTNKIYSFYAKTLSQGQLTPKCPDNPKARMRKLVSGFAIGGRKKEEPAAPAGGPEPDGKQADMSEAQMAALEKEFSGLDENDPKAMARMMRRMADLSGEKLDGPMEDAVRKLEEGADPDSIEEGLSGAFGDEGDPDARSEGLPGNGEAEQREPRARFRVRRLPPVRDPKLYDYE